MSERTTPTGIPITLCAGCGSEHPATRHHCAKCGRASLFLDALGRCLGCADHDAADVFELEEPDP